MNKRRTTPLSENEKKVLANLQRIWNQKKKGLGLTQEKAAHAFGWSAQANVSQYLTGKITLGLETGLKFSKLLRVQPSELNPDWSDYDLPDTSCMSEKVREALDEIATLSEEELDLVLAQIKLIQQVKR